MVHPGDEERKQVPIAEVKPDSWSNKTPDETVTLSKSQLRAFLEVIGHVGNVNVPDKPNISKNGPIENGTNDATSPIYCSVEDSQANGSAVTASGGKEFNQNYCPLDTAAMSSSSPQQSPSKSLHSNVVERKRMQWAKEKAENIEWHPWGKPGAGAPIQRPVASVAPRTENQLLMVQAVPYLNNYQSCLPSPNQFSNTLPINEMNVHLQDALYSKSNSTYSATHPIKPVPPVFQSSIAFGYDEESANDSHLKKQQWLRELSYQREDQRLRKLAEQEQTRLNLPEADWLNGNKEDLESISIMGDGTTSFQYIPESQVGRTYVRGQGFKLDPVSAAKAEERRQKAQEYQQAIRLQMEEKQRRVQEEKERKRREEEELEQRLEEERAKMQEEYELEQRRIKEKVQVEEKKEKVMRTAIEEAQAQAEAEKKSKKKNRQKPQEELHSESSPVKIKMIEFEEVPYADIKHLDLSPVVDDIRNSQQTATVRPIQSSPTSLQDPDKVSLSKELGIQTLKSVIMDPGSESEGYIVNRVLTPSFYRLKCRSRYRKDFGTQTDINYGKWIADDETTDHSCSSSISAPLVNRLTRVQHSKPYKASRHHLTSDADSISERPKWGVNQPSKSFIRMTDRDPHFMKRRKLQELRKQHWEREMAVQQALKNARRSINASYPSLRNRRAKSSSEGTAGGFSSSELETSQVQSHSPPRYRLGYRSVCGSAEDVAYFGQSSTYTSTALPSVHYRRDSQSSDNLPSIVGGSEPPPSRLHKKHSYVDVSQYHNNLPPMRRKWHSQGAFYPHETGHLRQLSPPVPAIQKHLLTEHSSSSFMSPPVHNRRKWSDQESFDLESVAMSRAKSQPSLSDDGSEQHERESLSSAESTRKVKTPTNHNPLVHPEVVTGRPTPRQDRILQNLSSLRKGLLQKQRELENFIRHPPVS